MAATSQPRTLRSSAMRAVLWYAADGKCQICGGDLGDDWEADHKVPWSVSATTNVHEMQAVCRPCNRRKGAKTVKDRQHQADLRERISRLKVSDFPVNILAWVVPGGGKSRLPGIIAERFVHHKIAWFVPRLSLQEQAARGMKKDFGIELRDVRSSKDMYDPSRGTRGIVATHDLLTQNPLAWRDELRRHQYILVIDECHHAKQSKDGESNQLARAISALKYDVLLNMTGTLETNDGRFIHGMKYDSVPNGWKINAEASAHVVIRYPRQTAILEKAILPIEFQHHDGPVKWSTGNIESEVRLSEVSKEQESAAIFTALRTDVAVQLFESGVLHWQKHGTKLIVVCDRQETAELYHKKLKAKGINAALAITDNEEAHKEIKQFQYKSDWPALVTCAMAYEGLDVPSATHLICLTHFRSVPWIEQAFGRIWRAHPGKSQCWAFVPDDARMNNVITRIKAEEPAKVGLEKEGPKGPGGERESVLALNGCIDSIRQAFLDGECSSDEARDKVLACVLALGLSGDEPEVKALIELVRSRRVPQSEPKTVSEEEAFLRKQIADECRKIDAETATLQNREPRFGETQKALRRMTNKSITDMKREELKRAFGKLASLRPR